MLQWGRVQMNAETAGDLIAKDPDVCGAGCEERQPNIKILCRFMFDFTPAYNLQQLRGSRAMGAYSIDSALEVKK